MWAGVGGDGGFSVGWGNSVWRGMVEGDGKFGASGEK